MYIFVRMYLQRLTCATPIRVHTTAPATHPSTTTHAHALPDTLDTTAVKVKHVNTQGVFCNENDLLDGTHDMSIDTYYYPPQPRMCILIGLSIYGKYNFGWYNRIRVLYSDKD